MAYQSLYRKYRPQRFAELVGQHHVSTALRNAVRDGRVGHAYLFSGPRGTGKTTTARLLAKAVNCTNPGGDGDPCGECESCVAIADGTSLDVIEVDAASRSKVDEMRDLLERVAYLSAGGAKKVYILDEVHMLSGSAEAALLKTLEEAPEHVVFVLATTDPLKVAPTIRSRTQHFEFTLYTIDELSAHLADVCTKEGIEADAEALAVIARAGAGSMRDALSLLDQAIAHGAIDLEQISALFGGSAFDGRLAILRSIADEDVAGALVALGEQLDAGQEPRRLTEDLLTLARVESGETRFDAEPVQPSELLSDAMESFQEIARTQNVELIVEDNSSAPVLADREAIHQVFSNLIENALKYAASGKKVALGARNSGKFVEFFVKDYGPGIPSEHLPRLFERFYRVDKARSRESGGTGLGLAIAKHIVLAHGGAIRAESELNHGSVFVFSLPAAQ